MSARKSRFKPCAFPCPELNLVVGARGSDKPLKAAHVPCAMVAIDLHVVLTIRETLRCFPFGSLHDCLVRGGVGVPRTTMLAARFSMKTDDELVSDMLQEVAIALHLAALRGGVASAVPAILRWASVTVPRIVRRQARGAAFLVLAAEPTPKGDANEELTYCEPISRLDGTRDTQGESDRHQEREIFLEALARYDGSLTLAERAVLCAWIAGGANTEIAHALGISTVAVGLRLMRAKRKLIKAAK